MQSIAVFNFKGGSLKTTSTQSIGAALAMQGKKVLLIDMDAQHNLTQIFNVEIESSVYDALSEKKPLEPIEVGENLFLAGNELSMIKMEMELTNVLREREYILRNCIDPIRADFDYILIDCPPSLGLVTINALLASEDTKIIVPVEPEFLGLKGFVVLTEALQNIGLKIEGLFCSKFDRRKVIHRRIKQQLEKHFKEIMFKSSIRTNVSGTEAQAAHKTIFEYAPNSNSAKDYQKLTKEIIQRFK